MIEKNEFLQSKTKYNIAFKNTNYNIDAFQFQVITMHYVATKNMQLTRKYIPNGSLDFNMQLYMGTIENASNVSPIMVRWRSLLSSKF